MVFVFLEPCVLGYHIDNQHEKDVDKEKIPMVEKHLSQDAPRDFVWQLQQLHGPDVEMLSKEMEIDDVDEVEQDGQRIGNDIDNIEKALWEWFENLPGREAIIEDKRQIEDHGNGQVEAHAIEEQEQGFVEVELMEELEIEKIEQPTCDAQRQ